MRSYVNHTVKKNIPKKWTPKEEETLKILRESGSTIKDIAQELSRPIASVHAKLSTLKIKFPNNKKIVMLVKEDAMRDKIRYFYELGYSKMAIQRALGVTLKRIDKNIIGVIKNGSFKRQIKTGDQVAMIMKLLNI